MKNFVSTFRTIWRLAAPYFGSEDKWAGRVLLATVVAIELSIVGITVLINQWNARFYNALQERNWDSFVRELYIFSALAGAFIVLAVYQIYLQQWLLIRWRTWMTRQYLGHWLDHGTHYRMQLTEQGADNPDQRIAEDIRAFIDSAITIGLRLLNAIVTLASFAVILWSLSDAAPFHVFGHEISVPGYLLWLALIYAIAGTLLTHWIGSPLIALNFFQQRYEADFRFNLVRVRESGEQIALLRGGDAEQTHLLHRFALVIANWRSIMTRTKRLTMLTAGYSQFAVVFPFIVVSPAYFASRIQLGGLMQTASAFGSVQDALSVVITIYRTFAEWRSVIERLDGFDRAVANARTTAVTPPSIVLTTYDGAAITLTNLSVRLPTGAPLIAADDLTFKPGDRVLLTGPSGCGKSTLFRAISGIWPFGAGDVAVPSDATGMVLPQRPYFPIGTLRDAILYPANAGSTDPASLAPLLEAVGLQAMAQRLDEEGHWNRTLSLGEQQRLGIVRALVARPDFLFLDEATASLDEAAEAAIYRLLQDHLKGTAIISIGHRSTLHAFHDRHIKAERDGDAFRVREVALAPAIA